MVARGQGTSTVGSVPKTKTNTGKSKNPRQSKRGLSSRHKQWHKSGSLREMSRQMKDGEVAHPWMQSEYLDKKLKGNKPGRAYLEVKRIIERKQNFTNKNFLTEQEVKEAAEELRDNRGEEDLDRNLVQREMERINQKLSIYRNKPVGNMTQVKENGRIRICFFQLNNMSSKGIRDAKIEGMKRIQARYDVDISIMNELGVKMDNLKNGNNFQNWMGDGCKSRIVMAYNKHDTNKRVVYQPGGTGIYVQPGIMTQYVKGKSTDFRNLGRWCSMVFWASPEHKTRIVAAYNICDTKPEGSRTQYQQIKRYCQNNELENEDPKELFKKDFSKQCKDWKSNGERLFIIMDTNDHIMTSSLTSKLAEEGIELEEFSHNFWGEKPPNSYVNGSNPIDAGYKSSNLEVTQLTMLPFISSVGDHMSWIVELTTRSMLGPNLLKTQRSIGRRLVTTNERSVQENNRIVRELFAKHKITDRLKKAMDQVDKNPNEPSDELKCKIECLHEEMDNIRKHASNKCRKILTPESEFSLDIQLWYDRIHAYKALLKMMDGPEKNTIRPTHTDLQRIRVLRTQSYCQSSK